MRTWKKLLAAGLVTIVISSTLICVAAEQNDSEQTGAALQIQTETGEDTQEAKDVEISSVSATGMTAIPAAETADPELPEEEKEESPFIGTWVCGRATVEISLDKEEDETDPAKKAAAEADKAAAGVTGENAAEENAEAAKTEAPAAVTEESAKAAETGAPAAATEESAKAAETGAPAAAPEESAKEAETGAPAAATEESSKAAETEAPAAATEESSKAAETGAPAAAEEKAKAAGTETSAAEETSKAAGTETPAAETPAGDVYKVGILWGSSYNEVCRWDYTCTLDKEGKILSDPGTGIRTDIVFGAEGVPETATVVFTDGSAEFTIDQEGKLLWNDKKEDAAQDMAFERVSFYSEAPSPEDLAEGFFRVIGSYGQGVSGTSLKEAIAACRAFGFAGTYDIMNVAEEELQQNLVTAWKSLKKEEQDAFSINYPGVISLVDSCLSNWEGARGLFEDAGVANEMKILLEDSRTRASWAELLAAFGKADTEE